MAEIKILRKTAMGKKKVFVTVGTTKFDKLIDAFNKDILDTLQDLGYGSVQFQTGTGQYKAIEHPKLQLKYDAFFENFDEQLEQSDLVIGHAGAGTCMEVLRKEKPLIVVINEDLMDNHQIELARHLATEGYLQYCTPQTLKHVLLENNFQNLKPYPKADPKLFSRYLDKAMGFT